MYYKKALFAFFLSFASMFWVQGQTDPVINDVSSSFALANSKEIAKYFGASVSISILNEESVYSKTHGEMLLKNFLDKNHPISSKVTQFVPSSGGGKYAILSLKCSNSDYRVSVSLKINADKYTITELRIDAL
ncbi:DUF4783 domain-containing protein [Olivibacter sitiensis]|uniref:DUF4783 domain-containing protein n=1 Tax=Olivibacter sitiensis TaxID=376470 RepID=UPI000415F079|nr:DUF4783 domain-containing protein [Olivibacter sitiensis]